MGVSKNRGTPKWMVYFMENPYGLMDDFEGKHLYFQKKKKNIHIRKMWAFLSYLKNGGFSQWKSSALESVRSDFKEQKSDEMICGENVSP